MARLVLVSRCAERVDRMFPDWAETCFRADGSYVLTDLNQPVHPPRRSSPWLNDCPITEFGNVQSQLIGRELRERSTALSAVFVSPSLRSVQTASAMLQAMKSPVKMCVEPMLFEATCMYKDKTTAPQFMSVSELVALGYPINVGYTPLRDTPPTEKNPFEAYKRLAAVTDMLMNKDHPCMLIVAHAITVDGVGRHLLGLPVDNRMSSVDLIRLGLHYPYLSMAALFCDGLNNNKTFKLKSHYAPTCSYLHMTNQLNYEYLTRELRQFPE